MSLATLIMCMAAGATLVALIQRRRSAAPWWWLLPAALLAAAIACAAIDGESRKVIGRLCMPLGLVWLAIGGVAVSAWMARRVALAVTTSLAFIALSLAASDWVGSRLALSLEERIPHGDPLDGGPYDAVLVLGGGSNPGWDGVPELSGSGDRVGVAAWLYLHGRTHRLVTTGDNSPLTVAYWHRLGIPASACLYVTEPSDTAEEIAVHRRLIAEHGWKRVGLVSSAWHLPRALRLCARAGFSVEPIGCDWIGGHAPGTGLGWAPTIDGITKVDRACWEYLGMWSGL